MSEPISSPAERIATIRSLIGHRKPSQHLLDLILAAVQGAGWQQIAEMDAAVRH